MSIRQNCPCDIDGVCPYDAEYNNDCEYWCGCDAPEDYPNDCDDEIWYDPCAGCPNFIYCNADAPLCEDIEERINNNEH